MFRNNNSRTKTQSSLKTDTELFSGKSNILGTSTSTSTNMISSDNEIMFAVITSNYREVSRLVNASNVNNIIDKTNNYTALHHAVRIRGNNSIIEYLMSIGANPKLVQHENKDCIDLSIEANYRYLIDKLMKDKDIELDKIYDKFDMVNYKCVDLKKSNSLLVEENEYLKKSSSAYIEKIEVLKTENVQLKRKYDESEKAFANLLKKVKK